MLEFTIFCVIFFNKYSHCWRHTNIVTFSAHPNVKVFLTHGGARSLEEAVFYKVPIVGFPIVRSRKAFIKEITKHGAGEILDPYYLDKETLKATITTVITQEK